MAHQLNTDYLRRKLLNPQRQVSRLLPYLLAPLSSLFLPTSPAAPQIPSFHSIPAALTVQPAICLPLLSQSIASKDSMISPTLTLIPCLPSSLLAAEGAESSLGASADHHLPPRLFFSAKSTEREPRPRKLFLYSNKSPTHLHHTIKIYLLLH